MYEFVGNLLGLSLRLKLTLPFLLPSLAWKFLVGEPLALSDLRVLSPPLVARVMGVLEGGGTTMGPPLTWSTTFQDAKGVSHSVDLTREPSSLGVGEGGPRSGGGGGGSSQGCWEERVEWARAFLQFHLLDAYAPALSAIRTGLYSTVPPRAIRTLTWWELEGDVCGKPEVDVEALKAHTLLRGYSRTSPTIVHFWRLLASWDNEKRSAFLRFTWGRSRLPAAEHWPQELKLIIEATPPSRTAFLPEGHTCFFKLDLPPYDTFSLLKSKLERAIVETNVLTL